MQRVANELKRRGRIGFVPTMGYLHEGHLRLVRAARRQSDFVVVSIFVNPIQFGPKEDYRRYPRDFSRDRRLLKSAGADFIFSPEVKEMYPERFATFVDVERLGEGLCGKSRPGHFRGVTTVVTKLFNASKFVLGQTAPAGPIARELRGILTDSGVSRSANASASSPTGSIPRPAPVAWCWRISTTT